jgi:glutamine synthetase
VLSYPILGLF